MAIEVFKTIISGGLSPQALAQKLAEAGIQQNEYARVLFSDPHFIFSEARSYDIAVISVRELGFAKGATSAEIFAAAAKLGLKLCPTDLAAFLRLQYLDQPPGPYLTVASAKMRDDEEYPNGFYLRHLDGILWLRGYRATSDYIWEPSGEFAFMING